MQFLPVPFPGPVDSVKERGDAWNLRKESQIPEIQRSIQRRRHQDVRQTLDADCLKGAEGLPHDKRRGQFPEPPHLSGGLPSRGRNCMSSRPHPPGVLSGWKVFCCLPRHPFRVYTGLSSFFQLYIVPCGVNMHPDAKLVIFLPDETVRFSGKQENIGAILLSL